MTIIVFVVDPANVGYTNVHKKYLPLDKWYNKEYKKDYAKKKVEEKVSSATTTAVVTAQYLEQEDVSSDNYAITVFSGA